MSTLKKELATLKPIIKKGLMSKDEMGQEIIAFIFKMMRANKWTIDQACEVLSIKSIYDLQEMDIEKLEGMMAFIDWAFSADGTYCLF